MFGHSPDDVFRRGFNNYETQMQLSDRSNGNRVDFEIYDNILEIGQENL